MQKSIFFLIFFMFYNIFFCFVILIHCKSFEIASLSVYGEMAFVAEWYKTFWMLNLVVEELVTIVMK